MWTESNIKSERHRFSSLRLGSPFVFKKVVVYGHCLVTLPFTVNEALKWLSSLPVLMWKSFLWWQYRVRHSPIPRPSPPPLHRPSSPASPPHPSPHTPLPHIDSCHLGPVASRPTSAETIKLPSTRTNEQVARHYHVESWLGVCHRSISDLKKATA